MVNGKLWLVILFCQACWIIGCGREASESKTIEHIESEVLMAVEQAKLACANHDPVAAKQADEHAQRLAELMNQRVERSVHQPQEERDELIDVRHKVRRLAREVHRWSLLTDQRHALDQMLNGWVAKGYLRSRELACRGTFLALSVTAEQAARTNLNQLPDSVQNAARLAGCLAETLAGRRPMPGGQPDWSGIAHDMRTMSQTIPIGVHLVLAVSHMSTGRTGLALYEIESIDPAWLAATEYRLAFHAMRATIYRLQGWRELSFREWQAVVTTMKGSKVTSLSQEELGMLHLLLAGVFLSEKLWEEAEIELMKANRAWPNNPLAVVITGERMLANGKTKKVARSLEEAAVGTEHEWLGRHLTKRAREIRDGTDDVELLFDPQFIRQLLKNYGRQGGVLNAQPETTLQRWLRSAQEFGQRVSAGLSKFTSLIESQERLSGLDAGVLMSMF